MTLSEVGAYQRLLNHQWACGSVPGDHLRQLAGILRCTVGTAKGVWAVVQTKFVRGEDGEWRNARMEDERRKQAEYRATQALRGKASAEKRWGKDNQRITSVTGSVTPRLQPERNPKPDGNSPSPFPFPIPAIERDQVESIPSAARAASPPPPLVRSSIELAKVMARCVFVGQRLEVPNKLHADFRRTLGGADPDHVLIEWYHEVDEEVTRTGEGILPDVFPWLQARFKTWAQSRIGDAEMAKFLEAAR